MYAAIFVLIGSAFYILGYIFGKKHYSNQSVGTLRIDQSDEDGPYLFLELNEPVSNLMHKESVVLTVKVKNYISQE